MTSREEALRALEKDVREYGRVSDRAGMTGVAEDFRDIADRLQAILATASEQAPVADEAMLDRALEAYDDMYEAQYLTGGHTDNRVAAMHAALIAALPTPNPHEADRNA